MEWQVIDSKAQCFLADSQPYKAKKVIEEGLRHFPGQLELLITAHNIVRCIDINQSLEYAQQIIGDHPDFFDGYARAAQDLTSLGRHGDAIHIIDVGLEKHPENEWILFTGLSCYNSAGRHAEAANLGLKLASLYPSFKHLYPILVNSLYILMREDLAEAVIKTGLESMPNEIILIRLKLDHLLRCREFEEYRCILYALVSQLPEHTAELLERIHRIESLKYPPVLLQPTNFECDIICIASDEAPYIAEFIHHYLYLEFRNVFIGINNLHDKTEEIIWKIQLKHKNVHVFNVDTIQNLYRQNGSYRFLFDHARHHSKAKYCLFADVDEFWVADPFPMKIHRFIADRVPFDVHCFQWLCCFGESKFSPPLSDCASVCWDAHVKSICSYESHYLELRPHSPLLANSVEISVKLGFSTNKNIDKHPAGLDVQQVTLDPKLSTTEYAGQAWIFHRIFRSEIEYSSKLFTVHANDNRGQVAFKSNRLGFLSFHENSESYESITRILPRDAVATYHHSLKQFLMNCNILDEIIFARSLINEDLVLQKLQSLPFDVAKRDAPIAKKAFEGTRFHEWILNNY
jgi:hypothetical protein